MTPPHHDLDTDIPVWNLEPDGKYTVKTGYLIAKELTNGVEQSLWNIYGSERAHNVFETSSGLRLVKPALAPSFTINSDGLVDRSSGNASAGGVLRDWQGRSIDAFTTNLGTCSITRAELTGIIIGMERAWSAGIRDLEIQTDSLTAVGLLKNDKATDHQHASLIAQFSRLLDRNWKVT
ncbi:Putative ribonuclease H protein At1g65750 [Linum perenne]